MRAPLSWLREYVDLPADLTAADLAHRLTALGLKLEALEAPGSDISGPIVVGRVLSIDDEPQKNGKVIRWCRVDVGPEHNDEEGGRGIVCGAHNFAEGDLVVVSLPGSVLPTHANHVRSRCARTSSIFTRAWPSSMVPTYSAIRSTSCARWGGVISETLSPA